MEEHGGQTVVASWQASTRPCQYHGPSSQPGMSTYSAFWVLWPRPCDKSFPRYTTLDFCRECVAPDCLNLG